MERPAPRAEVTVFSPLFSPFRHPLHGGAVSIGRASECTLPIKDRYLSRKHAEIVAVGGAWVLKDCGSANGTYLNGVRVNGDKPLKTGDRIRLGDTEILFESTAVSTDKYLAVDENEHISAKISIPAADAEVSHARTQEREIEKLRTLTLLGRELLEERPADELFGFILDRVMQHLRPSRAAIGLLGSDGKSFVMAEVRRADESDSDELRISHTLLHEVVEEKKALAFTDVGLDEKLSRAQSIIMQGIHSIICAPLMIGDVVVGLLYVDYLFGQRDISEDDVRLVAQIARFAAIKLETTRLREESLQKRIIDEELKMASMIQRRLLPPAPPKVDGYSFVSLNRPCRTISGDYYDFVVRPDGRIYFVIADVSGKGITAGLMMAGLQAAFRIFSKNDPEPAMLMSALNMALRENLPQSKFVTLFLGRLDPKTGVVEYANAGHIPPLWIRSGGVEELPDTDLVLGVITRAQYLNRRFVLAPGDALILFTDGVTEAEDADGSELGTELLRKRLAPLHGSSADVMALTVEMSVMQHIANATLADDVTLVIVARDASAS
jgi:serine phosphatase RsbU (regulator of sigma subunit)/pSer/pThr/pTyr-binding forkhead associated (FHA) protein